MERNGVILKCLECVCVEVGGEIRKLFLNVFFLVYFSCDFRLEFSFFENEDCFDIFSEENIK